MTSSTSVSRNFVTVARAIWCVAFLLFMSAQGCSDDSTSVSSQRYSALSDSSFAVGDSSTLEISNFAGKVDVKPGAAGTVSVAVRKWAARAADLDGIDVEMVGMHNGVRVTTANPAQLNSVSVDLEVTVPADTRPTLQVAAGYISYEGRAEGECFFATAAGSITLALPADINVAVHLTVGTGTIRVDFPVSGLVNEHEIDGTIGTGVDGSIVGQVGAGGITVIPQ